MAEEQQEGEKLAPEAEEQQEGEKLAPEAEEHKMREVVIFLPAGGVRIPGPQAQIGDFPNGAMYVDAIQPDGSVQRYVNVPFVMVLASNRLVQPVTSPIIATT